jgi:hypothetical protein
MTRELSEEYDSMTLSFIPTRASAATPLLLDYSSSGKE